MINHLRGLLVTKHPPTVVIEVNGVGYEVEAPMSTCYHLPELNHAITLLTHLVIREDAHTLYGFLTEEERWLFRTLIRVNGVGPKLALSILSSMELTTFVQCIRHGDTTRLTRIPGIGKKTAERLLIEMRDRLDALPHATPTVSPLIQGVTSVVDDAISALVALGYKPQEASHWVQTVNEEGLSSEDLIRRALQAAL